MKTKVTIQFEIETSIPITPVNVAKLLVAAISAIDVEEFDNAEITSIKINNED